MSNQNLTLAEARAIDALSPGNQVHGVGSKLRYALNQGIGFNEDQRYYVDSINGNDNNDGLSWEKPFLTIQYAYNVARYIPGTTTVQTAKDQHKYIFIATGQYNEQIIGEGYNIHIIGVSPLGNGTYGVVVNYDAAIVGTAIFSFTGSGLEIANICFNCTAAIPIILLGDLSEGVHIHDCWIKGDAGKTVTIGISCDMQNSIIEDNVIDGCIAGIDVVAAADFINCIVRRNKITNVTNGIAIANTAVPDRSAITDNIVIGSTSSIVNAENTDIVIDGNKVKPVQTDAGAAEGDNTLLS